MHFLSSLSQAWILICSIASVAFLVLLAYGSMRWLRSRFDPESSMTVVSTMLSGILLPTGMVIAFVATDVWRVEERGRMAVEQEAAALADGLRIIHHLPAEKLQPLRQTFYDYIDSVLGAEWRLMAEGRYDLQADMLLDDLMSAAVRLEADASTFAESLVGQELRKYVGRIELARDERLRISKQATKAPKWITMYVLLFVSACVLVELHMGMRRAQMLAAALFSLGFGVTIYLILSYDSPFTGTNIIEPIPLQELMVRLG